MNDTPQAHLVMLVAGAVIAAALLSVAAGQASEAERAVARDAADSLAGAIGFSRCSPATSLVEIDLQDAQEPWSGAVREVMLFPSFIRVAFEGGVTYTTPSFSPLRLAEPLSLLGAETLMLAFDPLALACLAATGPAENA